MSTRSFIAKQVGDDQYLTVYCHSDGYLTYNGALLLDCYSSPEKVDELLALGDISLLNEKLYPDPDRPHSFDYRQRQDDVTVAYARDRGDKNTQAKVMTLAQLDDPGNWTEYVYIFTRENEWKYFHAGDSKEGLLDVRENLEAEYASHGLTRPEGFYGFLSRSLIEIMRQEQAEAHQEQDNSAPVLTM